MKKLLLTIAAFVATLMTFAQAPNMFNYQGVARNAAGNVLPNQSVGLRLSILNGAAAGPVVYSETRTVVTNAFGLFNVQVGGPGATNVTGTIAGVNWSGIGGAGTKYLQVEIDPVGGTNYVNVGSTQMLSVPYALTAAGAFPIGPAGGDLTGNYPNPGVARIRGVNVTTTAPTNNYVLGFNGTDWTPTSLATHPDNYWRLNGTNIYNANAGNVGIGTNVPNTLLANNSTNTLGTDATGLNAGSLNWSMNSGGYAAGVYNASNASGANGLAVKVAGTTANNKLLDLSTGAQATLGSSVMVVRGDGNVGIGNSNPASKLQLDNAGTNASASVTNSNAANVSNVIEAINVNPTSAATSGNGGGSAIFARKGTAFGTWLTNPAAIYATSSDATGIGVVGLTIANIGTFGGSAGTGVGVLGQSFAAGGIGVYGIAGNAASYGLATQGRVIIQGQGAANGNILGSDAVGNATWRTPTSLGLVGGTGTASFIPRWTNANTLGNSLIFDNGTNVAIGTTTPTNKFEVIQTGTTAAGSFTINNPASVNTAVNVAANGFGSGVSVQLSNAANGGRGIDVTHSGVGPGVFATSAGGSGVWGITSSISAAGVIGDNTFGEAVVGRNRGGNGVGAVVGRNDSSGYGVRGFNTRNGIGVLGQSGISGGTGTAGRFENVNAANTTTTVQVATNGIGGGILVEMPNASNGARGIDVNQQGVGPGVFAVSQGGNAVWGITASISAAGVIGDNTFGEAVVGRNRGGNGVGAVVGRNDSSGYGVRGFNTKNGIGVLGQTGISGGTNGNAGRFENVNAANGGDVVVIASNGTGNSLVVNNANGAATNLAVFRKSSGNVARIADNGQIFANGGFTTGGADVAEYFAPEGDITDYEPGDVLVISQTSDRKIERSSTPYSTLVSGVYATKPGITLTEENAVDGDLSKLIPMGVIGVIPTKVCLEGGAIKRGDLLVTSSIPGVAMKADLDKVKVGQVIGKALQSYDATGTGKINVLVSVK